MSIIKDYTAGIGTLIEWFGRSCTTVDKDVATARALICEGCPKNKMVGWKLQFGDYAQTITGLRSWLLHKGKVTKSDKMLGVCEVCNCPMKVKVWVPIDIIRNHMDGDTMKELPERCWITK